MADFLANLAVSIIYHSVLATRKLLKPVKIAGTGKGALEKKLGDRLKKQGWIK